MRGAPTGAAHASQAGEAAGAEEVGAGGAALVVGGVALEEAAAALRAAVGRSGEANATDVCAPKNRRSHILQKVAVHKQYIVTVYWLQACIDLGLTSFMKRPHFTKDECPVHDPC